MKIERNKKELSKYPFVSKIDMPEVKRVTESAFENELAYRQEAAMQFRIKEILGQIEHLGESLSRNININDLMRYKKLVRDFLKEATSEAYQLSKKRGRNRRGRTLLMTVNTIDAEVEKLINDFRGKKSEPMEILETLDKIRGMLVDLMI
ncbi:MAG: hypothetical protein CVU90_06440 [Firmicutes bacterium HGW-Firmicutes-15]|nr:MAG: hypothetical protein CVU90_06440 [Firmicutes bacterium HGW-Firmicutes-15]